MSIENLRAVLSFGLEEDPVTPPADDADKKKDDATPAVEEPPADEPVVETPEEPEAEKAPPKPKLDDPAVIDVISVRVEEAKAKFDVVETETQSIGELSEAAVAIESLITSIRTHGVPRDNPQAMAYMNEMIQSRLKSIGVESVFVCASVESYVDVNDDAIVASLEGILSKIYDTIMDSTSKTWKWMEDFVKDFYNTSLDLAAEAEALKRDLATREDSTPAEQITIIQAHKMHLGGRVDAPALVKGYENLVSVNRKAFPKYLENVGTFYKNYFRSYQKIVGTAGWAEKLMTGGQVIEDFIESTKKDMDAILGTGDARTEFSGGYVFDVRNMVYHNLPELVSKHPDLDIQSHQVIAPMTPEQINAVLDAVIENATIIKTYWGRVNDLNHMLKRARADAAEESKSIDQARFFKLVSRFSSHLDLKNYGSALLAPLHAMSWHSLSVTRSMVRVASQSVHVYPRSIQ
jgi:hypothetical protein